MPFAESADGAQLWYEATGRGPDVVLLHGLADTHELWRYQIHWLSRSFRVIAIDTRGHGRSSAGHRGWGMATLVEDVLCVADAVGAGQFGVVGLSMGGGIAQGVAIAAPERVWLLALIGTSASFAPDNQRRFTDRADLAERAGMEAVVDATVPRWFTPAFRAAHPEVVESGYRTVLDRDPAIFAAASRVNAARDFTARLREIRCPAVYVAGREDPGDVEGNLAVFRAGLPRLDVHLLDGAAHLVPVERPLCLTRILVRSLTAVAPGVVSGDRGREAEPIA
jgi:3-oxoadipate enol-lactonase